MDFKGIRTSCVIHVGNQELRFSTRDDYYEHLHKLGIVKSRREFQESIEAVAAVQSHWHGRGAQGCMFAKLMSKEPGSYNWDRLVVHGTDFAGVDTTTRRTIARHISDAVRSPDNRALSMILPDVTRTAELVALLRFLEGLPGWSCEKVGTDADAKVVGLGLRLALSEDPLVQAFVIILGPFDYFPPTRRSPFTEVAFPTKPKGRKIRKGLTRDRTAAHLADVEFHGNDSVFARILAATQRRRKEILHESGINDPRAAAKVTATVPITSWH